MFTLGIPKSQYRRTTQVLGHESSKPIPYDAMKQEDGFYMFSFPEADEFDFKDIVRLLKLNGVTTIGADAQLTEREIMKLVDLVPLKEGSMQARELADYNSLEELQAMYDQLMRDMEQEAEPEGGPIADQYADQMHDIEQAIAIKRGKTKDVPYDVAIGRMTQDEYDKMMSTVKPDRASFEKSSKFGRMNEGTCGYSVDGKPANKPAGPDLLRKAIRKEIRSLNEDSDNKGYQAARKLIAKLREKTYRSFSDEDLDAFSKEMVLHLIDNVAAEAAVRVRFAKQRPDEYKPETTDDLPFE
jgi:hypothetical protein